jgi:hypothetical protein
MNNSSRKFFLKQKITNRSIAVKFVSFPENDDYSFVVHPQKDGLGFINSLNGIERIGFPDSHTDSVRESIGRMNAIFSEHYTKLKKDELSLNSVKHRDDVVLFLMIVCSIVGMVFVEIPIFVNDYFSLAYVGVFTFFGVFGLIVYYALVGILMNTDKQPTIIGLTGELLGKVVEELNDKLAEVGFRVNHSKEYFWIRIIKSEIKRAETAVD